VPAFRFQPPLVSRCPSHPAVPHKEAVSVVSLHCISDDQKSEFGESVLAEHHLRPCHPLDAHSTLGFRSTNTAETM
jgi:hypothetical protein